MEPNLTKGAMSVFFSFLLLKYGHEKIDILKKTHIFATELRNKLPKIWFSTGKRK
jgi:hypothetical protein